MSPTSRSATRRRCRSPGYVEALRKQLEPQAPDWFAYKLSEPRSQAVVAESLTARTGLDWDPADVAMTNGGFAALAVAFRAILEPGDEVVFLSPPWFFYELLILAAGGIPVRVPLQPPAFDLDLAAIAAAITPRTRAVLLNSPHNPSGRVYPLADLRALAAVLEEASVRATVVPSTSSRTSRTTASCSTAASSTARPRSIRTRSRPTRTARRCSRPGMRIGYLTVPPTMPDREALRQRIMVAQLAGGFLFPNALLQHALGDLEKLSIDVSALERRRDRLVPALRDLGFETTMPEGTFYVMARSPIEDDEAFGDFLAEEDVLILPGTVVEVPGWFRISLTASDAMVERSLAGFERAREKALAPFGG